MKKSIAPLVMVLLFFSCASSSRWQNGQGFFASLFHREPPPINQQATTGFWVTRPSGNALTIIGISNPMTKRAAEITAAQEDAAKKAAMYHGVWGSVEYLQGVGSGFLDYTAESAISLYYDPDYAKYIDRLTFDPERDVLKVDGAVIVRFKYAAAAPLVNYTTTMNDDGRPNWTYNRDLPQIDGYISAVGFAQNQARLKDTIRKSTESAVARLISEMSVTVMSTEKSVTGVGASTQIYTKSEGSLANFHVIEFWIDPQTKYVYTLAIAKRSYS